MNNMKLLKIFLLVVVLLLGIAKAQEEEDAVATSKDVSGDIPLEPSHSTSQDDVAQADDDDDDGEKTTKAEPTQAPVTKTQSSHKTKTEVQHSKTIAPKKTTPVSKTTSVVAAKTSSKLSYSTQLPKTNNSKVNSEVKSNTQTPNTNASQDKVTQPISENTVNTNAGNPVAPQINNSALPNSNDLQNTQVITDGSTLPTEEESGGSGLVTKLILGMIGVCAVAGVATVGVKAYNKKNNSEDDEIHMIGEMEAQEDNNNGPESYNAYNIMSNIPNQPYMNSPSYENKQQQQENITTTPFEKQENNNFMSRESIFSNSGNVPQIGNDVFNFQDNEKLPYIQEYNENEYNQSYTEPISKDIQEETYSLPRTQMPTLVPVQPEITITTSEDENVTQEGYKQIVPKVAQMEIIDTPDYNNMTTSMIEDHINNMDLEQLANTEEDTTTTEGYKQIVPDIQEAVIENFPDIEEEDELEGDEIDASAVTDTYRAALRATYCSVTDENRFSYRTIDSDHSLLHNIRENGQW